MTPERYLEITRLYQAALEFRWAEVVDRIDIPVLLRIRRPLDSRPCKTPQTRMNARESG